MRTTERPNDRVRVNVAPPVDGLSHGAVFEDSDPTYASPLSATALGGNKNESHDS